MIHKIQLMSWMVMLLTFTSCYEDNSTLATLEVDEIVIDGIKEMYNALSDNGEFVEIQPKITTGYPEAEMEYHWYIYEKSKETAFLYDGKYYDATLIGSEKNLKYPVNMGVGSYTIFLKATCKTTDYTVYKSTTLEVATRYTAGFYVLKETAAQHTELDFLSPDDEKIENVLERLHGTDMPGTPRSLTMVYNRAYIDPTTHEPTYGHTLNITTQANSLASLRTSDLVKVDDLTTMFYATVPPADEVPYILVNGVFSTLYVSNSGIYTAASGGTGIKPEPSGKFGHFLEPGGASPFLVKTQVYEVLFWNESSHGLYRVNMNGGIVSVNGKADMPTEHLDNYTCMACGSCFANNKGYVLFEDVDGNRMLYQINYSWSGIGVEKVKKLGAELHFASADLYAFNAKKAVLGYCVQNNKLYACNLEQLMSNDSENPEVELKLEGIPAGEQITSISNVYWDQYNNPNGNNFDYLVVTTQTGSTYQVYMYELLGGHPMGKPVRKISGTGRAVKVVYASPKCMTQAGDFMAYPY